MSAVDIDKRDLEIETVVFEKPMHNPRLRSEKEGEMACAFHADILINGEYHFVDTTFTFSTHDFWTVGEVKDINMIYCFASSNKNDLECIFTKEQERQIVEALASQITYDKYSWFTKTVTKQPIA